MIRRAFLFMLWFLIWMLLSWPCDAQDVVIGIFAASFVFLMTRDFFSYDARTRRSPMRYLWFIYYTAVFLWECIKANIDVAYRVIHPDLPIRPGTVRVKTTLTSDAGLTFLANSITLTPGTTTVDIDKERGLIYIHCINLKKEDNVRAVVIPAVEKFEKILKRIFE